MFNKVLNFLIVVAFVVCVLAGIGNAIYAKTYEVAAFIVILGAIGFPTFRASLKALMSKE